MSTSHLSAFIVGALSVLLHIGNGHATPPGQGPSAPAIFHPAESAEEKALDDILVAADNDHRIDNFILNRGGTAKKFPQFSAMFTDSYLRRAREMERALVKRYCGGAYLKGEICGYNSSALNCGQSNSELGYFFKTESRSNNEVVIVVAWESNGSPASLHRMMQRGGKWMIDGVDCLDGVDFNFKR